MFLTILFSTKNTSAIWGDFKSLIYLFFSCLLINSYISPLFSLDKKYIFPFLSTNLFFTSITWSYIFLIGILLLVFFPKTWIHLWNLGGTSLLASFSDFATSSSSSLISYSSRTFFIFIVLFFFSLPFFFFFFLFSFSFCSFPFFFLLILPLWFFLLQSPLSSAFFGTSYHFYFFYFPVNFRVIASKSRYYIPLLPSYHINFSPLLMFIIEYIYLYYMLYWSFLIKHSIYIPHIYWSFNFFQLNPYFLANFKLITRPVVLLYNSTSIVIPFWVSILSSLIFTVTSLRAFLFKLY